MLNALLNACSGCAFMNAVTASSTRPLNLSCSADVKPSPRNTRSIFSALSPLLSSVKVPSTTPPSARAGVLPDAVRKMMTAIHTSRRGHVDVDVPIMILFLAALLAGDRYCAHGHSLPCG